VLAASTPLATCGDDRATLPPRCSGYEHFTIRITSYVYSSNRFGTELGSCIYFLKRLKYFGIFRLDSSVHGYIFNWVFTQKNQRVPIWYASSTASVIFCIITLFFSGRMPGGAR